MSLSWAHCQFPRTRGRLHYQGTMVSEALTARKKAFEGTDGSLPVCHSEFFYVLATSPVAKILPSSSMLIMKFKGAVS